MKKTPSPVSRSHPALRILLIVFLPLFISVGHAQTQAPPPYITIDVSKKEIKLNEPILIRWTCFDPGSTFPEQELQFRYRLDVVSNRKLGNLYKTNTWSDWMNSNKGSVNMRDFLYESEYKITVQCRNSKSGRTSSDFSETFRAYWENPDIAAEAFEIDWEKANKAPTEKERNQVLAAEYRKAYEMWNRKYVYQCNLLKSTISPEETLNLLIGKVGEGITQEALISMLKKSSQGVVRAALAPFEIADLINAGAIDLILIYRNYEANKAASMAAVSYWAWKYFEKSSW